MSKLNAPVLIEPIPIEPIQIEPMPDYAELHCISNFTFLRGASHPEELAQCAAELGYTALAITDECSVAGVVRAHVAAKQAGLKLLIGSEFRLDDGLRFVLLAQDREGYANLCQLITLGRRAASKGNYHLTRDDLAQGVSNCLALWLPDMATATASLVAASPDAESFDIASFDTVPINADDFDEKAASWLAGCFPDRLWIAIERLARSGERARLGALRKLGQRLALPCVATGDVHMHIRERRMLQDTLTAIRFRKPVSRVGYDLHRSGERHLRRRETLERIYPRELLAESVRIARRCDFSLDSLRYEYPEEIVPPGQAPSQYLRQLVETGLAWRFPSGITTKVRTLIEHELTLISELHYEPYFLTVYDIVRFARNQDILCQGRGSAANSAVCYALGITEVDPARMAMLFERFISKERDEPPDIDVDFEHERREEVIQYIYKKYSRERAALAATVVTYRAKSAFRDVGKALGLNLEQVERISKNFAWWDQKTQRAGRLKEAGFDPDSPVIGRLIALTEALSGFPRHLSQHVGGFVISRGPLSQLVPVENAAMKDRSVIQWDKDDLDALGLLKIDILALGMLSAIRRALALISQLRGTSFALADVPPEDPKVYEMITRADTIGVFQIESRAQMSMLPRLRPKCFYDLVIEVAIVRPGPIQGGMVHPYLRRRQGIDPVIYPSEKVRAVLERTLGVPIFQEQVMQLAVVAAGFTAGEADHLRRSMAAWRRKGGLQPFEEKLISGMRERGYSEAFAKQIFQQILGFGEYGFPESHSASFALLVYVSCWLKHHEPAAFTCALLNSQPMGFYAPSQLVQDAQRHGVEARPVDILESEWMSTLEREAGAPLQWGCAPDPVREGAHEAANDIRGTGRNASAPASGPSANGSQRAPDPVREALVREGARAAANDIGEMGRNAAAPASGPAANGSQPHRGSVQVDAESLHTQSRIREPQISASTLTTAPADADTLERENTQVAAPMPSTLVDNADTLEQPQGDANSQPALRLGFRMVKGLSKAGALRLIETRQRLRTESVEELLLAAKLSRRDMECLAAANALAATTGHRHNAAWTVAGIEARPPILANAPIREQLVDLPAPTEGENVVADYASLGLTLGRHPLALLRLELRKLRILTAVDIRHIPHGTQARVAGIVTCRQRPGTASGVVFVTLEDETGFINVVVWGRSATAQRRTLLGAQLMAVHGHIEREGDVIHLVAGKLVDYTHLLNDLITRSRNFH
jgi:error-prone DNA polymerase